MMATPPAPRTGQSQTAAVCCRRSPGGVASLPGAGPRAEGQTAMQAGSPGTLWSWTVGRTERCVGPLGRQAREDGGRGSWSQGRVGWSVREGGV